jgi:CDP-diacylglycerol---serine O-phosphatidyltransferase
MTDPLEKPNVALLQARPQPVKAEDETDSEFMDDGEDHEPTATLRKPRKGIYILPNLFTVAALFGGFYGVVMAINGRFSEACVAIFWSMVLDSLDGRVARMTGTQSEFGAQMDSLSDMVSFGLAPGLIVYEWVLKGMGKIGWGVAFVYTVCAALRLARFNTNIGVVDKRYFQGLPSPAAAALVVGFIWLMDDLNFAPMDVKWAAVAMTLYAGLTMVTLVPFYSFKDLSLKKSVPFIVIVGIALAIALVASTHPPTILFGLFFAYGLSGYILLIIRKARGKKVSVIATSTDEPGEKGLHR